MSNMFSLNNVGPMTEQAFGSGRFLASYLIAGASGNLLSAINRCVFMPFRFVLDVVLISMHCTYFLTKICDACLLQNDFVFLLCTCNIFLVYYCHSKSKSCTRSIGCCVWCHGQFTSIFGQERLGDGITR